MSRRLASLVAVGAICTPLFSSPAIGVSPAVSRASTLQEVDARRGQVNPTLEQANIVSRLGAQVTWNQFGTPHSLIRYGSFLATGLQGADAASAARSWVQSNRALFRLSSASGLQVLNQARLRGSDAYAVLFGQQFGGLPAAEGGQLTVGIKGSAARGWKVAYASSTLAGAALSGDQKLSAAEAWTRAADDVGFAVSVSDVDDLGDDRGWSTFRVAGLEYPQRARLVAVPTPLEGARPAYETILLDPKNGTAFVHFIDAETGAVLVRRSLVHYQAEPEPKWKTFPAYPRLGQQTFPWNFPNTDIREIWCWAAAPGCDRVVRSRANAANAPIPWDEKPPANTPTNTTEGNNARTAESWGSAFTPGPTGFRPVSPNRRYAFPWDNEWHENRPNPDAPKGCAPENYATPGVGNDISAAVVNLFVGHNRMHDWTYWLGFTEQNWNAQEYNFGIRSSGQKDPLIGDVQAGAFEGSPSYLGRDNANMITVPDGQSAITNMYLWQPVAGAAYVPCVDGDFDMAVIGHEFGHMVENRMIGKGGTRAGHHAGAMGESYGDLMAMEYLNEYGFVPVSNENPYAVGAYATGNFERGVRNYAMNYPRTGAFPQSGTNPRVNPLNFSDMGYDIVEQQVHANGEIWSAVNFDIRRALTQKYGAGTPALQRRCADGKRPANECPGNRRWIQTMFDAFLFMPTNPSMLQARDAYMAANQLRFDGADWRELWFAFARRGFGVNAFSTNSSPERQANSDTDPTPNFESPLHGEAVVRFRAAAAEEGGDPVKARVYVGHYEARVSPIADTDPATDPPSNPPFSELDRGNNLDNTAKFVPGTYEFIAQANGYGLHRFRLTLSAGERRTVTIRFPTNWASRFKGAAAAGEGSNHQDLIDDTESTTWDHTGGFPNVRGSFVIIDLAGGRRLVDRVKVSTLLRTLYPAPEVTQGQNRFTALRQFRIQACTASGGNNCAQAGDFTTIFTSQNNTFPGFNFRPVAPEMILREFNVPDTRATHLRIVVLDNQCTGDRDFHGDQDNDPSSGSDCRRGSPGGGPIELPGEPPQPVAARDNEVHISEVQVFSRLAAVNDGSGGGDDGGTNGGDGDNGGNGGDGDNGDNGDNGDDDDDLVQPRRSAR